MLCDDERVLVAHVITKCPECNWSARRSLCCADICVNIIPELFIDANMLVFKVYRLVQRIKVFSFCLR